jgi:hypothetical protein
VAVHGPSDLTKASATVITGAHNLIVAPFGNAPIDTISACPLLEPLADNGGPTLTHALLHNSPAIDMGDNLFSLSTDQRGPGFPRKFGFAADIGAFEYQGGADDRIFRTGFETASTLCDQ